MHEPAQDPWKVNPQAWAEQELADMQAEIARMQEEKVDLLKQPQPRPRPQHEPEGVIVLTALHFPPSLVWGGA